MPTQKSSCLSANVDGAEWARGERKRRCSSGSVSPRALHILETLVEILLEGRASSPSCTCNTDASPSPQARRASLLHRPSSSLSASLVSVNFSLEGGGRPLPLSSQTRRLKRHSEKAEDLTSLGGALLRLRAPVTSGFSIGAAVAGKTAGYTEESIHR